MTRYRVLNHACSDCGTPVRIRGQRCAACARPHHLARMRAWKDARGRPAPRGQGDPALPPIGAVVYDDDGARIQCHACGRYYVSLSQHLRRHDLTAEAYRERYGLDRQQPLVAPVLSARMSAKATAGGRGEVGRPNLRRDVDRTGTPGRLQSSVRISRERRKHGHPTPPTWAPAEEEAS